MRRRLALSGAAALSPPLWPAAAPLRAQQPDPVAFAQAPPSCAP